MKLITIIAVALSIAATSVGAYDVGMALRPAQGVEYVTPSGQHLTPAEAAAPTLPE